MRCFPTEHALELFLAGDQNGRVAGTAWAQFARDLAAGDAFRRSDNFQDREATAVADVEGFAGNAVDLLKSADVRIGNIEHMDVIADAGAVRRGLVSAEDIDMGQSTVGGIENPGNEMSFHAMMLDAFLGCSGSVEIAETHIFESGVELVIGQNLFEHELGFAIRIDGRLPMVFRDGNDFGFAVSGGSGRKNEFLDAVARDRIEQVHTPGHVRGVENTRLAYRFGDQGFGGKGHHRSNPVVRQAALKGKKNKVSTAAHAELTKQVRNVKLHSTFRNVELAGNLFVRKIFEQGIENLLLAAAQIRDGIGLQATALAGEDGINESGKKLPGDPESSASHERESPDQLVPGFDVGEKAFHSETQERKTVGVVVLLADNNEAGLPIAFANIGQERSGGGPCLLPR